MGLPHIPTGHLGDQFDHVKHVTGRTLRAIDRIEHQHNVQMKAGLKRQQREGHKDPLRGPLGDLVGHNKKSPPAPRPARKVERFEDGSYIDAKGRPHRHDEKSRKSRDSYGGRH